MISIPKNALIPLLVAGMLATGCSNSLFSKWQDMQCVENCSDPDDSKHVEFSQPVLQTAQMFFGECLCLLPVLIRILYQSYFKSNPKSNSIFKSRDQNQSLDSEPLLSKPSSGSTEIAEGQGATASSGTASTSQNESRSTGNSTSSPTLSKHPNSHHQNEARGRSRIKRHQSSSRIRKSKPLVGKAIFLFFTPALCDICGTTLMNVGLLFTPVSIYQMTRGALVLWVGIFSVIFLRRHLFLFQWLSLITVMLGVCVVGLSGTILKSSPEQPSTVQGLASTSIITIRNKLNSPRSVSNNINLNLLEKEIEEPELPEAAQAILGVLLILFAQLFTASQFVLEEKIMSRYSVEPLLAVGYEGLFGLSSVLIMMPILHWWIGMTPQGRGGYFDMFTGWNQMVNNSGVLWSSVAIALSIALFNFFGLSVTRSVSATARSTIDTCRTLGIWIVSLYLGWEVFLPLSGSLQIVGFLLLVLGTFVFNGIIVPPKFLRPSALALAEAASQESRSKSRTRSRSRSRAHGIGKSRRKHRSHFEGNGNENRDAQSSGTNVRTASGDARESQRLLENDLEASVGTLDSRTSFSTNGTDQLRRSTDLQREQ